MNWLRNFMAGRYGTDQFSIALLILYLLLSFVASLTHRSIFMFIAYIPIIYCLFRIFSRNIYKRQDENYKFLKFWNPISAWFKNEYKLIVGSKTQRYFKCPKCRQVVRVPKGKGKIRITCPKCRFEFLKKS